MTPPDEEAVMNFEKQQQRKALRKLAAEACAEARDSRNASGERRSSGKVMLLVGATLFTCLGWLAYSRMLQGSGESVEKTAAATVVNSNNPLRVASGTSTSASSADTESTEVSKSDHADEASTAHEKEAQTYDERLEQRIEPVEN